MKNKKAFLLILEIVVLIIILAIGYFTYLKPLSTNIKNQKISANETAGWKVYTNKDYGFELKYPADFFDENQQPKLLVGDCNYNVFPDKCPDGNAAMIKSELSNPGYWDNPNGEKKVINNTNYCLYTTGDAATGHAFNYYYFATVKNKKCLVAYLSTVTANCDFYLPLEEGNTEQAKNYNDCLTTNKNQPIILNKILSTFKFN